MNNQQAAFRALADPTRREILLHLSQGDLTIGEVKVHFDITRGAIKKHLNILEEGRLISVHARGRERINHLEPAGLKTATEWLNYFSQFWDEKLGHLKSAIENDNKTHRKLSK